METEDLNEEIMEVALQQIEINKLHDPAVKLLRTPPSRSPAKHRYRSSAASGDFPAQTVLGATQHRIASKPAPRTAANRVGALRKNKEGLARVHLARPVKSAITYFPAEQYHRLQELNFCVRDGNRCDPLHMVTDKSRRGLPAAPGRVQKSLSIAPEPSSRRLRTDQPRRP